MVILYKKFCLILNSFMKKIFIDSQKCVGCGTCSTIAPKTFKVNKNGKAKVISDTGNPQKDIDLAIFSCPMHAISQKDK